MGGRPHVYRMETLSTDGKGLVEVDYLIAAAGSDVRGVDVLRNYAASDTNASCIILLEFEERTRAQTKPEFEAQRGTLDALKLPIVRIEGTLDDPSTCIAALTSAGIKSEQARKVGVDMTLLTRPFLFWLLKYLGRTPSVPEIVVYYTEPESYRYARGTFDTYQATEGPLEVREVPGFPGTPQSSGENNLTVLLGFDGQLATAINEDVAPRETIVVNGFPSYFQKYKDISLVNNERLVSGARDLFYAPADNPFETYNLLHQIRDNAPDTFMTVAPLGPKPMALGACLFAIDNDDVRLVYPRPKKYVSRTTRASWQSWRYDVRLGGA